MGDNHKKTLILTLHLFKMLDILEDLLYSVYPYRIFLVFLIVVFIYRRVIFLSKDDQLEFETLTELNVINGPKVFLLPFTTKAHRKFKATTLTNSEYVVIQNKISGETRNELGPMLVFLKPYDEIILNESNQSIRQKMFLKKNEFVRFLNKQTGKIRTEIGEQNFPGPEPNEIVLASDGSKRSGLDLKDNQYCIIENSLTGDARTISGPNLVFLEAYEEFKTVNGCQALTALSLKCNEYVKIQNLKSGNLRTVSGEGSIFLGPFDEIIPDPGRRLKREAIEIDEDTAVIVRNKKTGQQSIVKDEKKLYIPGDDEEVEAVRQLEVLADYEAMIIRRKDGDQQLYFGSNDDQRSFFLPPYCDIVSLTWSRGRRRERRDLTIQKVDLRPMFMSFEFNCRTSDNVELILEGTVFWQIVDLAAMIKFTSDTTGDICAHARALFIEKVSKVTLQKFMSDFNKIAEEAHKDDQTFYTQRGIKIHSLEVTGYKCAENDTANILREIIQETTNRMNRLQQQESENEVKLFKIKAEIETEKAKKELLEFQRENFTSEAAMEGQGEAEKVKTFLESLEEKIPDVKDRVEIWKTLRQKDILKEVGQGNAKLFLYSE